VVIYWFPLLQDQNQIYLLKTPFRTVFVLPPQTVTQYGWLPEHKICTSMSLVMYNCRSLKANCVLETASAVDLGERFLSEYDSLLPGIIYISIELT
jgi:hypothetical protein